MIASSILKLHTVIERRTWTELVTGLSVITVIGATLYNLGFFIPIEWSLISLLTVQDLLTGAVVALFPMSAAVWVAWMASRLIQTASSNLWRTVLVSLPVFTLAGAGFYYFFDGAGQWTIGHLACGYVLLALGAAYANLALKMRWLPIAWLAFSLVYIPISIGISDSLASTAANGVLSEVETDEGLIRGRVVRFTSAYVLIAENNAIVTIPISKIKQVRRLYSRSPESDFLTGQPSTVSE